MFEINRLEFINCYFGYANINVLNSVYHDALVIINTDEDYERFYHKWVEEKARKKDKNENIENISILRDFRLNKINRLNFSKKDFLIGYQNDPLNALEILFQESVRNIHMKGFERMLGEDSVELLYDAFSFRKEERFPRFLTIPVKRKYELEKEFFIRAQNNMNTVYTSQDDISLEDVELHNSFSTKNQTEKLVAISRLVRDTILSRKLKIHYNYECQVCNQRLQSSYGFISEAHHIRPYNKSHKGDDSWGNMIVLCPNCHAQFDELYFAIEPQDRILYCIDENHPFNGKKFTTKEGHELQRAYLEYAWGKFLELKG